MRFKILMNPGKIILCILASLFLYIKSAPILAKEPIQSSPTTKAVAPIPFTAKYDLFRGSIKMGESVYSLKNLGENNFLLEASAAPAGLMMIFPGATASEMSFWKFTNGQIQPEKYKYRVKAVMVKKKMLSLFDWSGMIATVTHNKKTRKIPIQAGDLDHSLVSLAVMYDLKNGKLKNKYRYVDRRRIKTYEFRELGKEWIQTSLGLFKATLVENVQRSKKRKTVKRRTIFWGIPGLDFLPVRISHQSGDDAEVVMTLTSLEGELSKQLTE